ncbi:uncharacterized protein A4U43_C03F11050 [Asparagus officinalis]|uniref:Uncharacterized protein n=1 Tax=Asparagus officinalis TaxID=4686 RepID=A0A5P1F915_ASPOF|nr:uncharacterized protein LOC109832158 [Asparagus officinalis]ONK74878.1 uncharacterized protein A4U43_C03F11050 [Asparagus officinalis]
MVSSKIFGEEEDEEDELNTNAEKQISVDPMSLQHPPPILPPLIKPKFISASLPGSATSSPEFNSSGSNGFKKWSSQAQMLHPAFHQALARQQSMTLSRSKSCGDGRSSQPSDEFDILSRKQHGFPDRPPKFSISESSSTVYQEMTPQKEEEFKCGALCLFVPGFAKKKQERAKEEQDEENDEDETEAKEEERASRVASLEKFECASWSSSIILSDVEDDYEDGINAYFDLPLELIRGGGGHDTHSPVNTAFVFDREPKGVLKKSNSRSRKSVECSHRHVRFSTSSPMLYPPSPDSGCMTPRFFRPGEELHAALREAQNAYLNF